MGTVQMNKDTHFFFDHRFNMIQVLCFCKGQCNQEIPCSLENPHVFTVLCCGWRACGLFVPSSGQVGYILRGTHAGEDLRKDFNDAWLEEL